MLTLTQQLKSALNRIASLESSIARIKENIDNKPRNTYSKPPKTKNAGQFRSTDIASNVMGANAGFIVWNDADATFPPFGTAPKQSDDTALPPTVGYNRHSHSRYSGGALDIETLELIAYNWDNINPVYYNKDSQVFWKDYAIYDDASDGISVPEVKTSSHADGDTGAEGVPKIGELDIHFDGDSKKWVASGGSISYLYPTWLSYS